MKYQITQNLNQTDYDWLPRNFKAGEIVFRYIKPTYGCISWGGVAVSEKENEEPFFEVPEKYLQVVSNQ